MTKFTLSLAAFATLLLTGTAIAAPDVVASTKPVHALVSAVMGDIGTPALIVKGATSPHTYSLRPSDAAALEAADIVFWTGHGMELFLADALETLSTNAQVVESSPKPPASHCCPSAKVGHLRRICMRGTTTAMRRTVTIMPMNMAMESTRMTIMRGTIMPKGTATCISGSTPKTPS